MATLTEDEMVSLVSSTEAEPPCVPCAQRFATDDDADPETATWSGVIGVEGELTGDGRYIQPGALRWENLPVPLRYVSADTGAHQGAVVVGRVLTIDRDDATGEIRATGDFDLGSEAGREAARLVADGLQNGVSMDLDDVAFEVRIAADASELVNKADGLEEAMAQGEPDEDGRVKVQEMAPDDEVMVTTGARVRAATQVAVPAFSTAQIHLDTDEPETYAADDEDIDLDEYETLTINLTIGGENYEVEYPATPDVDAEFNWVDDVGGLPKYIKRIANAIQRKGKTESHAIAIAVNAVKKMCATGDINFPGKQDVNVGSRAQACAAVLEWEQKKARARADSADSQPYSQVEWEDGDDESLPEVRRDEADRGVPTAHSGRRGRSQDVSRLDLQGVLPATDERVPAEADAGAGVEARAGTDSLGVAVRAGRASAEGATGRRGAVRRVRGADEEDGRGSLSRERRGAGTPVRSMQHGTRSGEALDGEAEAADYVLGLDLDSLSAQEKIEAVAEWEAKKARARADSADAEALADTGSEQFKERTEETRKRLAESGEAMEDGSYPIVDCQDLKNAIQAIGRAKDPAAVKKHIKRRAKDLGCEDVSPPEDWAVALEVWKERKRAPKGTKEGGRFIKAGQGTSKSKDGKGSRNKAKSRTSNPDEKQSTKAEKIQNMVKALTAALDDILDDLPPGQAKVMLQNIKRNAKAFVEGAAEGQRKGGKASKGGGGGGKSKGGSGKISAEDAVKGEKAPIPTAGPKAPGVKALAKNLAAQVEVVLEEHGDDLPKKDRQKLQRALKKLGSYAAAPDTLAAAILIQERARTLSTHLQGGGIPGAGAPGD